jgi:hypothetical protein
MIVSTLIVALATGFQASADDVKSWVNITSKAGNFLVDMPKNPTTNESVSARARGGGRVTVFQIICDTPEVFYMVKKIELPKSTGLKKSEVDEILDFQRDETAREFNGKVITEKEVMLDIGAPGRDFTIEGRPKKGGPMAAIRVRCYFAQKAIYTLIAASGPDEDLPEDVGRFFASFAVGTTRVKKSGPKPEPKGKPLTGWGTAIDPDGDCKILPKGKALEMRIPGTHHDLNADNDKLNGPRVVKEVTGDFTITVKVLGEFKPNSESTNSKAVPYEGAGILV